MATDFPQLSRFTGEVVLDKVDNRDLIIEIQLILKRGGFLDNSPVDGIPGLQTMRAFANFKEKLYLQHPTILGSTTAKLLLEIVMKGKHHTPHDTVKPPDTTGKTIALPAGMGVIRVADKIPGCRNYSWSDATKGGLRVPDTKVVVQNIIKMGAYLDKVCVKFGYFSINSWYRPLAYNRSIGSSDTSRHVVGDGVDGKIRGIPPHELYRRMNSWHGRSGGLGDSSAFSHIDCRGFPARWDYQ